MRGRTLVIFSAAIVIAAIMAIMVRSRVSAPQTSTNIVKILAAGGEIAAGTFVKSDRDLVWLDWPKSNVTEGLIVLGENMSSSAYNGAVARRSVAKGEPIQKGMLVTASDGGFMSAVLSPGTRAVTISVNPTSGNAGFVFPGDKVDLILTHRIRVQDEGADTLASETFVENVRVLAVDQRLDNPDNKAMPARTLTLEVTPKQAERINVASNLGTISVSLRSLATSDNDKARTATLDANTNTNSGENTDTFTRDTDVSRLLGDKGTVRSQVNVFRGHSTEKIDFHQEPTPDEKTAQ